MGKVAVITGASDGIGKAIAIRAADEGMKLVLASINPLKLDAVVAEFKARDADVIGVCTDVSKAEQVEALAAQVFSRFGNVHLLVNNAGVAIVKPVWKTTPQDWDWVMGVNLYGVTNCLRAFIPAMLKNGEEGHIINTSSMAGLQSQPSMAAYNASKHAVVTVSEGLHHDLALSGAKIKVSVLCPLWVKTKITQAERNRPSDSALDLKALNTDAFNTGVFDPVVAKTGKAIFSGVRKGITADRIADAVFDAIQTDCFYILTDPDEIPKIRTRMEDILHQRAPTFSPIWKDGIQKINA